MWQPWKRRCRPYNAEKLLIPLPVPHPAHIAVTIHNRDSEDPIPLDSELCQNILKAVEDSHAHQEALENVSRFRGGAGDSSFDSVASQSEDKSSHESAEESYRWRHTEWRHRNNSGSVRVDLASPEDVTLDTDATRVVFSSYGTTV